MRVMLLFNQDVAHEWANGTRARLLPKKSWSGVPQRLKRTLVGHAVTQKVHLQEKGANSDFNVVIVKELLDGLGAQMVRLHEAGDDRVRRRSRCFVVRREPLR